MIFHKTSSAFDQKVTIVPNPLYVGSFQPPRRALGEQKSLQNRTKWVQKWQKCKKAMNYSCFGASPGSPGEPLGAPRGERRGRPGRGSPAPAWAAGRRAGRSGNGGGAAGAARGRSGAPQVPPAPIVGGGLFHILNMISYNKLQWRQNFAIWQRNHSHYLV